MLVAVVGLAVAAPSLARAAAPESRSGRPASTGAQTSTTPGNSGTHENPNGKPQTTTAPGHGSPSRGSAQGIVQSVAGESVVLTLLDGSSVSIAVTSGTRVFVDGSHASVGDVRPGFVVSAAWVAGKARVLEAFDLSSSATVGVGVVGSVSSRTIVVRRSGGGTVRVRVGPHTRVLLDGDPATLGAVRPGYTVVFAARDVKSGKPAGELRFLRPV